MSVFSERLRKLRNEAHITQAALGDAVNLHKQTISQYERGVRQPDFANLEALCDYFNVSTDYLLGKSDYTPRYVDPSDGTLSNDKVREIPVLGGIASGREKEEDPEFPETIVIPKSRKGEYGALRVSDDSMAPRICEGDTVIFRKQDNADSGDIVIVMTESGEYIIRQLVRTEKQLILKPFNPVYDLIVSDAGSRKNEMRIIGKAVENRQTF